ncbi:unnamed protein product [Discosporangium mesarthrocarpum]
MGKEYTRMGRLLKVMVDILVKIFGCMLTDDIVVRTTYFDRMASAILAEMGMEHHEEVGGVCCFIDGTLRPHCRPDGDVAQVVNYSGYRRNHGMKFQGVVQPNGIMAYL